MDGADRDLTLRSWRNLAPRGNAVGLVSKTQNRPKHHLSELSEMVAPAH